MTQAFCYWFTGLSWRREIHHRRGTAASAACAGARTPSFWTATSSGRGFAAISAFPRPTARKSQRRVAEVAAILLQAGVSPIVAFISPLAAAREEARRIVGTERFFEVYINTPLEVAEARRDPKGLYKKVRAGLISQFTGISSPFEAPEHADCVVPTVGRTPQGVREPDRGRADRKRKGA